MPLRTETTVEYYFNNAYLYYCEAHACLRVSENHEDSVLCNGVRRKDINNFIENYFEYVLEDTELKEYFKSRLDLDKDIKRLEKELSKDEDTTYHMDEAFKKAEEEL